MKKLNRDSPWGFFTQAEPDPVTGRWGLALLALAWLPAGVGASDVASRVTDRWGRALERIRENKHEEGIQTPLPSLRFSDRNHWAGAQFVFREGPCAGYVKGVAFSEFHGSETTAG